MGWRRGGRPSPSLWIGVCLLVAIGGMRAAIAGDRGLCGSAIAAAQARYAVPPGLLYAIGQVESGRPDAMTRRVVPWPWAVQAEGQSYYFATEAAAVSWVQAAEAKGIVSIDVGCMQVNLHFHPAAFATLDDAFDPSHNADYAARFLISLHAATEDWQKAAGLYHSQTLALALPYAQRVEAALSGRLQGSFAAAAPKPTLLSMLRDAWGATLDTQLGAAGAAAAQTSPALARLSTANFRSRRPRALDRQRPVLLSYER